MQGKKRQAALLAAWLPMALMSAWLPREAARAENSGSDAAALRAPDAALQAAVASGRRSANFITRDTARKPAEELAFFGLRPDATVVEIWPGRGYWSEILAPYLAASGTYYAALPAGDLLHKQGAAFREKLAADPVLAAHVKVTDLGPGAYAIAPPGSVDFVLTFRNLHNWMELGNTAEVLAAFHAALKPGGILAVEDHRGDASVAQDPKADDGYVRQDYAIKLIEKAGFKFIGSSEMNANPRDTKHYEKGVWTLPPTYELGEKDHAKYKAIGEADNFVLKFRRD